MVVCWWLKMVESSKKQLGGGGNSNMFVIFTLTWEDDPIWLTHIFQMGGSTTNYIDNIKITLTQGIYSKVISPGVWPNRFVTPCSPPTTYPPPPHQRLGLPSGRSEAPPPRFRPPRIWLRALWPPRRSAEWKFRTYIKWSEFPGSRKIGGR